MPDDGQIVRDEEVGEVEVALERLHQVHDLSLDGDVERGDGLVADDEVRVERERAGEADALALAAGELVRVAGGGVGRQADDIEELAHALARLAPLGDAVDAERLTHDPPHAVARVQGRVRVLEDHLHAPAQRPQGALAQVRDVLPVEDHVAVRRLVQAQDRPAERGLAAAGLADEPERLATLDGEGDVVDGLDVADMAVEEEPALDREPDLEVLDVDERAAHRHRCGGRLSQPRPPSTSPTPPRARG